MLTILLITCVSVILAWFVIAWTAQRYVIWPGQFRPQPHVTWSPDKLNIEKLKLPLDERDPAKGEIEALFLPGIGVSSQTPGPMVVFAHGNGELIQDWAAEMWPYRRMGVSVLMPEYRGYGASAGSPDVKDIISDFTRWVDLISARPEVDSGRIIFHGRSIGGGVIGELSRHRKPAAVVLESTFTSISRMARRFLVPDFLVHQRMDVNGTIHALKVPVLVVHGDADRIIPLSHAQDNHDSIPTSVLHVYPSIGHNDPLPSQFHDDLKRWLQASDVISSEIGETLIVPDNNLETGNQP